MDSGWRMIAGAARGLQSLLPLNFEFWLVTSLKTRLQNKTLTGD